MNHVEEQVGEVDDATSPRRCWADSRAPTGNPDEGLAQVFKAVLITYGAGRAALDTPGRHADVPTHPRTASPPGHRSRLNRRVRARTRPRRSGRQGARRPRAPLPSNWPALSTAGLSTADLSTAGLSTVGLEHLLGRQRGHRTSGVLPRWWSSELPGVGARCRPSELALQDRQECPITGTRPGAGILPSALPVACGLPFPTSNQQCAKPRSRPRSYHSDAGSTGGSRR